MEDENLPEHGSLLVGVLYTKRKKRKHQVIRIIDTYRTNSNRREIDVSYQETSSAISSWRHCPGYHGAYITNREPSITALHEAVVRHATELSECPATRINRPSPRKKKVGEKTERNFVFGQEFSQGFEGSKRLHPSRGARGQWRTKSTRARATT